MIGWLTENWLPIAVPVVIFLAFSIVALWVRGIIYKTLERHLNKARWQGSQFIIQTTKTPFFHWWLILGAFVAIEVSVLPLPAKVLAARILGSLLVISLTWILINLTEKLLRFYMGKLEIPSSSTTLAVNAVRIAVVVVGVLILLDIWGAPTTPIILMLATVILVAVLAARNVLLDVFSGFELMRGELFTVGDYVKLDSGEEGYIEDIAWTKTRIKALSDNIIVVPNGKFTQATITNYGRPLKKATKPFHFYTRLHLKELTGLKASNLAELAQILGEVPDSVVYYHTHHFLEEHQYLTPEPANDFALWVDDSIGDKALAEKLASIDIFEFPNIEVLRTRIISVINEYLLTNPNSRVAPEGMEFHFIKSTSVILPTAYVANDLREFIQVLRGITIDSLYFHVFESRLRLQKGTNDFSTWLQECLGEDDLANKIAKLDPYNYTLEGLRSAIIQLIEKRIK